MNRASRVKFPGARVALSSFSLEPNLSANFERAARPVAGFYMARSCPAIFPPVNHNLGRDVLNDPESGEPSLSGLTLGGQA